ncbi:amino acid permease, partial [Actinoplanes sp. NPDC051633]|uniref:amino acid permease n=1 Tax=Actinoplanes sp. NPDC051633 TaxID=3155670 RepID=UPI00342265DA
MSITTPRGIALYVGALLGPGLLVLPGLAADLAGPASILAWAGLLVLSGLVAIVFAVLGVKLPSAGGVAAYARLGLGERAGRATGWAFLAGIVTGAPVVCDLGAAYLGFGRAMTAVAAGALLVVVLLVTRRGVRASAGAQLGLVGVLLIVVVVAVTGALPAADAANWAPFAPHGWPAIGSAATVL